MNTTVFITLFFKKARSTARDVVLHKFCTALTCVFFLFFSQFSHAADLTELEVERADDGVYLTAIVRFDLPPVVEDALIKGIAMFFVAEADIYQNRWYWADRRVASAVRTIRLAYQPLTRRWRVNIVNGLISNSAGLRATLNQNYETLPEAMSAVQRLSRWRIADNAEVDVDAAYRLLVKFNLDLSQLPRPFQIGVVGQRDWTISAQQNERLQLAAVKPKTASLPAKEADK